jgi:hypothetical protein
MLPTSATEHYRRQQRITVVAVAAARREWRRMGQDFDASWRQVGPRLTALASAAQLASARGGADYIGAVLAETNQIDDPVGRVNTRRMAGVASDGRPLDTLLYTSVTTAKVGASRGLSGPEALSMGGRWLDGALATITADAGRQAAGIGIAARPAITGYVRMTNPPCCSRCAILAGKHYRWNKGFQRHTNCDCVHIPASEDIAGDLTTNPQQLVEDGQVTDLTRAQQAALDEGADLNQVINANRGMSNVGGRRLTTEGTTRRGLYGRRGPRPTPEQIYRDATDRTQAIGLLRRFGYLL